MLVFTVFVASNEQFSDIIQVDMGFLKEEHANELQVIILENMKGHNKMCRRLGKQAARILWAMDE
jgi:hypothetical protein